MSSDPSNGQTKPGAISILGGKGDGTLSPPITYQLQQDLQAIAVSDFNGDGLEDVAALNGSLLSLFTSAGDATLRPGIDFGAGGVGFEVFNPNLSVGDFNVDGANDIAGVAGAGVGLLLNSAGDTVELAVSPDPAIKGHEVTLSAKVVPSFHFSGGVSAGGLVSFYDGTHQLGTSNVVNGRAVLTMSNLAVGTHSLTAVYSGNRYHVPSRSNAVMEIVRP